MMSETTDRERAARAESRREGLREAARIASEEAADDRDDASGRMAAARIATAISRLLESEEGSDE